MPESNACKNLPRSNSSLRTLLKKGAGLKGAASQKVKDITKHGREHKFIPSATGIHTPLFTKILKFKSLSLIMQRLSTPPPRL